MNDTVVPMDKLARVYRKIKAEIDEMTKEYDTKVELLKEKQTVLKFAMKDQMQALGVKSVNTAFGTVSMIQKTRYSTQDWDSFKTFIVEHDAVDLLEKRIAQNNMVQFLAENPTLVPPGLNAFSDFEIRVNKPSN